MRSIRVGRWVHSGTIRAQGGPMGMHGVVFVSHLQLLFVFIIFKVTFPALSFGPS